MTLPVTAGDRSDGDVVTVTGDAGRAASSRGRAVEGPGDSLGRTRGDSTALEENSHRDVSETGSRDDRPWGGSR